MIGNTENSTVYDELVKLITEGVLPEGSKIPSENELRVRFGVSRNTIRLVLNRLRTMGMIETRRGDGSYVKKMGANLVLTSEIPTLLYQKHDFIDILEFRKGVEIESVKIAAQRRTDEDLLQMKGALMQMKRNIMVMDKFFQADDQMHLLFAKATKNEMFSSMLEIIQNILTEDMKSFLLNQGTDIDSYFYHESILSCLENRKPEEAGFMMDRHLSAVIERIRKYYKGETPKVSLETT